MKNSNEFAWSRLVQQAQGLLSVSTNRISNGANLCALIYQEMSDISWVGFYLVDGETLELGPFQGKPACVSIAMGEGVCGTAAVDKKVLRVADVDEFDGHIVCDPASRSEIVLPLVKNGVLIGVLDVDSEDLDRFQHEDEAGLLELVDVYLSSIN